MKKLFPILIIVIGILAGAFLWPAVSEWVTPIEVEDSSLRKIDLAIYDMLITTADAVNRDYNFRKPKSQVFTNRRELVDQLTQIFSRPGLKFQNNGDINSEFIFNVKNTSGFSVASGKAVVNVKTDVVEQELINDAVTLLQSEDSDADYYNAALETMPTVSGKLDVNLSSADSSFKFIYEFEQDGEELVYRTIEFENTFAELADLNELIGNIGSGSYDLTPVVESYANRLRVRVFAAGESEELREDIGTNTITDAIISELLRAIEAEFSILLASGNGVIIDNFAQVFSSDGVIFSEITRANNWNILQSCFQGNMITPFQLFNSRQTKAVFCQLNQSKDISSISFEFEGVKNESYLDNNTLDLYVKVYN